MIRRAFRRRYNCSPTQAMDAVRDLTGWPSWRRGLLQIHSMSDDELHPGTTWVEERMAGRSRFQFHARSIEVGDPMVLSYRATGPRFDSTFRWAATWGDECTILDHEVVIHSRGLRALFFRANHDFLDQQSGDLNELRSLLRPLSPRIGVQSS